MKENKKIFIVILVLLVLIGLITVIIINNNKKGSLKIDEVIDKNDENYKDKDIYEEDGNVVIEDKDGNKTVISDKEENKTDLEEANKETQEKYELIDIKVELIGNMTKVSGKIKSNASGTHKVSILTKFNKEDGKLAGSMNAEIDSIKKGETKAFSASMIGNYTSYKYNTIVEFTN